MFNPISSSARWALGLDLEGSAGRARGRGPQFMRYRYGEDPRGAPSRILRQEALHALRRSHAPSFGGTTTGQGAPKAP